MVVMPAAQAAIAPPLAAFIEIHFAAMRYDSNGRNRHIIINLFPFRKQSFYAARYKPQIIRHILS